MTSWVGWEKFGLETCPQCNLFAAAQRIVGGGVQWSKEGCPGGIERDRSLRSLLIALIKSPTDSWQGKRGEGKLRRRGVKNVKSLRGNILFSE